MGGKGHTTPPLHTNYHNHGVKNAHFWKSPSVTHLYRRVCLSIHPSVHPCLCLCKDRVSWLSLATVRSCTESNDWLTCFESFLYYSCNFICLFVHLSLHMSHVQYTQGHSPDASLPGRACYFIQLKYGVQGPTLGRIKLSRLLTRWNVFPDAFATNQGQK